MEFHRHGRIAGVNAIETQYRNLENNVDDNGVTYNTKSTSSHERTLFQFELEKNQPLNKRARYSNSVGVEELKELPTIWEEIVTANEEEQVGSLYPSEVFDATNPTMWQHNDDRVSETICLLPGYGSKSISNGSNLKTRLCNKWELTGWCPFGDKCHFAHGSAELRGYDGQLVNTEAGNSSICNVKQTTLPAKAYHAAGIPSRRLPNVVQKKDEEIPTRRWKGPDKISKIYGDWIDDL